jgi:transcriptional regulator with XRE-family HTH domain
MKNNIQLRRMIRKYLKHPRSFTQNELARRSHMDNSTLSEFIKGKHNGLTSEQEAALIDIIAPWERDPVCVAGRIKTQLLKQYYSKSEIAIIATKMIDPNKETS